MLRNLLLLAAVSLLWQPLANAQNVIVNGDFETPPFDTNTTVTNWTVTGHAGELTNAAATSDTHVAALSAGANSDMDTIAQTFATTIGQNYTLTFDAGVFGVLDQGAPGPLQLQVEVLDSSAASLVSDTFTPPANNSFDPTLTLQHYIYNFTADTALTTLKFTDHGTGNTTADVLVDTVVVVPEPTSCALLIMGAGSLAWLLGKRRARV